MLPLKFSEYSSTFENINICLLWAEISSFSRQRFHRKWWPKISEIWWSLLAMRTSSDYSLDIRSIWTFNWKINSECFFSNCHGQDLSSNSFSYISPQFYTSVWFPLFLSYKYCFSIYYVSGNWEYSKKQDVFPFLKEYIHFPMDLHNLPTYSWVGKLESACLFFF